MKEFFERNKSIFIIGVITIIGFFVIILMSQTQNKTSPLLVKVEDQENMGDNLDTEITPDSYYESIYYESLESSESINDNQDTTEQDKQNEQTQQQNTITKEEYIDRKYGIKQIDFTETGFSPKNTKAFQDQIVKWTNKTSSDISLLQRSKTFVEFDTPIVIKPGESFEFRLYKDKLWTYIEQNSQNYGSIFIVRDPLYDSLE